MNAKLCILQKQKYMMLQVEDSFQAWLLQLSVQIVSQPLQKQLYGYKYVDFYNV